MVINYFLSRHEGLVTEIYASDILGAAVTLSILVGLLFQNASAKITVYIRAKTNLGSS